MDDHKLLNSVWLCAQVAVLLGCSPVIRSYDKMGFAGRDFGDSHALESFDVRECIDYWDQYARRKQLPSLGRLVQHLSPASLTIRNVRIYSYADCLWMKGERENDHEE